MPKVHLKFLDGIRGLAALYVMLFHQLSAQQITVADRMTPALFWSTLWLRYGQFAVVVFIVLSGFCLMLPVSRNVDGRIPGGTLRFVKRRARRILPPYWAALALSLALMGLARLVGRRVAADDGLAFAPADILTHFLLIHNLFLRWNATIDLPMWTVAMEWQIYFAFALLLIPIRRRFGTAVCVVIALSLGYAPGLLLPAGHNFDWTRPWYLGMFSIGMAAATIYFRPPDRMPSLSERVPWGWVSVGLLILTMPILLAGGLDQGMAHLPAKDLLVALLTAALLVYLSGIATRPEIRHAIPGRLAMTLLQSQPLIVLGAFSYSLYLTHMPLMWTVKAAAQALHLNPYPEFTVRMTLGSFYILAMAFGFYWLFERPFTSATSPTAAVPALRPATFAAGAAGQVLSISPTMIQPTESEGSAVLHVR